jgi:hypothetical protein
MTMQHPTHPDDERLAALAGDDPEVAADTALRAHVDSCDRCGAMVRELGSLRAALAELPDLVPSRPLQLLPPVAEPRAAARGGWLRRLAGPAMAAGFVLVVVGAVGSSGFALGMGASAGQAPTYVQGEAASEDSEQPTAPRPTTQSTSRVSLDGSHELSGNPSAGALRSNGQESTSSPKGQDVAPPAAGGGADLFEPTDPRMPWLVVLGLGVGLLLAGIYLRFAQQPRAG